MVKRILDKSEYIHSADVEKFTIGNINTIKKTLFGKEIELYNDPWMWHLHLKITDACNADCAFCVEKGCKKNDKPEHFLENLELMLT